MFGKPKNEIELLKASLGGNTQAFGVLVGRYQSLVCAITYSATGSVERSEELAQEVFLKAWKSLGQLQDPGKFRAWLSSIARSTVQNWFRSRQRDVVGTAAPLDHAAEKASEESGPVEAAIIKEQRAVVSQALAQIPESFREPLVLFYREQKSIREVAYQLGLSENAARQRISRARHLLREQVAGMVETTIAHTRPGKAFTTAVLAAVAGTALKTSTSAAAVGPGQAATMTGGTYRTTLLMSGLPAKVAAVAAGAILVAGTVIVYRHFMKPAYESAVNPPVREAARAQDEPVVPISQAPANPGTTTEPATQADRRDTTGTPEAATAETPSVAERTRQIATAPSDPGASAFKPKGVLSGLITDIETGEPVQDARVEITMNRIHRAETDATGFYFLDEIQEAGNFRITITSNEYVGSLPDKQERVVHLSPDRQVVEHFQLPKACMVDVWVVDANGAGIAGARVVASSLADDFGREVNGSGWLRQTDPNGYILLGGFPPARTDYLITAWHEVEVSREEVAGRYRTRRELDYAPSRAVVRLTDPNLIKRVQIVLERGQEVHGYAEYADGVPVTNLNLSATPAWWHCTAGIGNCRIGSDGTFTLKQITPGMYNVAIHMPIGDSGYLSRTVMQTQLPVSDDGPLLLRLVDKSPHSLVAISGTLVFHCEPKPRDVRISASSRHGSRDVSVGRKANGEIADTFTVDRLEPGTYTLRFSGENIEDTIVEDVEAPNSNVVVELVSGSRPKLAGSVVDAQTGEPVKVFRVRAAKLRSLRGTNYTMPDKWVVVENEQGRFTLDTVGAGVYQVQVAAPGYAPAWSEVLNTDEGKPAFVMLTAGGAIVGTVVNERGEPVNGAQVIPHSLAGGVMPDTRDLFLSTNGAVETAHGAFALEHLPVGSEALKIAHPDYTFAIVTDIQVAPGRRTEAGVIVLTQGGTVEGFVYDSQGRPQVGVGLCCQDESGYRDSQAQAAGQLGTAVTDANGFYRLAHLPEQLCYVKRMDGYQSLGVVSRTVMPRNGQVVRLDFGGTSFVTGTVIMDGIPVAARKLRMAPADTERAEAFTCYALTDERGRFTLGGVPPGPCGIYYDPSGSRAQWVRIAIVNVTNAGVDLGVLPRSTSKLLVTLRQADSSTPWKIDRVFLTQGAGIWSVPIGIAEPPTDDSGPWSIKYIEPGDYWLNVAREDFVRWRENITLAPGPDVWEVPVDLPKAEARVSGNLIGETGLVLAFWREQKDILGLVLPRQNGLYRMEYLPAGRYFVGGAPSFRDDLPPLAEFDLQEGEDKVFDLGLSDPSANQKASGGAGVR